VGAAEGYEIQYNYRSGDNYIISKARLVWAMADHPTVDTTWIAGRTEEPQKNEALV
jgi:hypothetical protein